VDAADTGRIAGEDIMHLVNKQNENNDRKNEVYIMMNVFKKFAEAYNENKVAVICGMAMMNGNTNVYPLYEAMTEESK
jgi:hypothetical protein